MPKPDEPAPRPIVRDPHSTKADLAVPLCAAPFNDSLETDGIAAKGDKGVAHPIPTYQPVAQFSNEARRQGMGKKGILDFEADLSLVVDITGRPQDVCLTQSAGWGLDAKAAEAVQKYQFNPAIKDGKPVAARIVVQVKFQLSVSKF
jgi:TonB family protein